MERSINRRGGVVVGVDFSDSSRRALEVATAVCARGSLPLTLLHVWNAAHLIEAGDDLPGLESFVADREEVLMGRLDAWASEPRKSGVSVSPRVVEGVASRAIPDVARSSRASLVVLGRRGSANLVHVLLGSVSERVVRLASCPVLVVPGRTRAVHSPERLLVGVDFSQASRDAYEAALRMATLLGVSRGLVLLHAQPDERELWLENWSELVDRGKYPYDHAALERWARVEERGHVPIKLRIQSGSPERLMLSAAESEACDWVVVGLQGRTALASLLMGSSSDRVLKLADRPVLVVPMRTAPPGEATG